MLGAFLVAPESVCGPRRRLHEDDYPPPLVVCLEFFHQRCERRRDAVPATREHRVLQFPQPSGRQPRAHQLRKSVLVFVLTRATYHLAAAKVLQIVGERAKRRDHI